MMRSDRLHWTMAGVGRTALALPWVALMGATLAVFALTVVVASVLDQVCDALRRVRTALAWRAFVRQRVREEIARPYRRCELRPARTGRHATPE